MNMADIEETDLDEDQMLVAVLRSRGRCQYWVNDFAQCRTPLMRRDPLDPFCHVLNMEYVRIYDPLLSGERGNPPADAPGLDDSLNLLVMCTEHHRLVALNQHLYRPMYLQDWRDRAPA